MEGLSHSFAVRFPRMFFLQDAGCKEYHGVQKDDVSTPKNVMKLLFNKTLRVPDDFDVVDPHYNDGSIAKHVQELQDDHDGKVPDNFTFWNEDLWVEVSRPLAGQLRGTRGQRIIFMNPPYKQKTHGDPLAGKVAHLKHGLETDEPLVFLVPSEFRGYKGFADALAEFDVRKYFYYEIAVFQQTQGLDCLLFFNCDEYINTTKTNLNTWQVCFCLLVLLYIISRFQ